MTSFLSSASILFASQDYFPFIQQTNRDKMDSAVRNSSTTTSSSQLEMVRITSSHSGSRTVEPSSSSSSSSPQSHVVQIVSPQSRLPSLELLQDSRTYCRKCVPLYNLALKGDWDAAKHMINEERKLLNAAIDKRLMRTLLHIAAGSNHVKFMQELVKLLHHDDLELEDSNGNTAFCFAAASGNLKIASILISKNRRLPQIRGGEGVTPLYMAALLGKTAMARFLYPMTTAIFDEQNDWILMFFLCISNGLHDLALQMLQSKPALLASARNDDGETGLHILARKPADFSHHGRWYHQNLIINYSPNPTQAIELVRNLWRILLANPNYTETDLRILISQPSQVTFDATEAGNFHFVAELMRSDPDLIWEVDGKNRSIIHIAVLRRHSSIFNLIHEIGTIKDFIVTFIDDEENNMLHHAAKLTPPDQLRKISGAALQMTHELLWFEEVKKIMLPSDIGKRNSNGKTPLELFKEEHRELLTKAESWTKSTANNCMLISTLIATGVFTATFNIPGGNNKNTGTPNYLHNSTFLIFAISNAIALISSSASILAFLSILISSYAEYECFRSLPFKLLFGLIAQLISITSMMIAFSVSFYITYYYGLKWVPNLISVLVFLPIPVFTFVLFPLWSDIIHSSFFCMSLFRPSRKMIY